MTVELSTEREVSYSPMERKLFEILKNGGDDLNTITIAERFYRGRDKPFHGRKIVYSALTSLKGKVEANKESFRIQTSQRAGGEPLRYWVEQRGRKGRR
jgi:hypothetical protein